MTLTLYVYVRWKFTAGYMRLTIIKLDASDGRWRVNLSCVRRVPICLLMRGGRGATAARDTPEFAFAKAHTHALWLYVLADKNYIFAVKGPLGQMYTILLYYTLRARCLFISAAAAARSARRLLSIDASLLDSKSARADNMLVMPFNSRAF